MAYWKLDETSGLTAFDTMGTHDGTVYNTALGASGRVSSAYYFGGAATPTPTPVRHVEVPGSGSLPIATAVTLEAWVKRTRFNELDVAVASNGAANPSLYVDGLLRDILWTEGAATVNLDATGTRALHIGAQVDPVWTYSSANLVDEVAVYSYALSPERILAHYSAGYPFRNQPAPPGTGDNRGPFTDSSRDPVNTLNGSFGYSHTDVAIAGRGPSPVFTRTYNSNDTRAGVLGPGWIHNYDVRLVDSGDGAATLVSPEGRSDRYTRNLDGSYTPPPGILTTLVKSFDGEGNESYVATHKDQTNWSFDKLGRLVALENRYGDSSALTYDNSKGQLISIGDPAGRGSLTLGYSETTGRLTSVTDWADPARVVAYGYDPTAGYRRSPTGRTGPPPTATTAPAIA